MTALAMLVAKIRPPVTRIAALGVPPLGGSRPRSGSRPRRHGTSDYLDPRKRGTPNGCECLRTDGRAPHQGAQRNE